MNNDTYVTANVDPGEVVKFNDRFMYHYKRIDPNSDPEQPRYKVFAVRLCDIKTFEENPAYTLVHRTPEPVIAPPEPGPRTAVTLLEMTVVCKKKPKKKKRRLAPPPE